VIATATFAVSHTFWSQAIIAEVYSLHALFVVAIVWLALSYVIPSNSSEAREAVGISHFARNDMSGKLLALTFGLSLTHHPPFAHCRRWPIFADRRPPTADH
jgi:hypothetical protein